MRRRPHRGGPKPSAVLLHVPMELKPEAIMTSKSALKLLFALILISMIVCTSWASWHQSVIHWQGLTLGQDRYWTIATLFDAYFGFLTFFVWVCFKEQRWLPRIGWFIGIMLLGNMAMSAYVLVQLMRLRADQDVSAMLSTRNS